VSALIAARSTYLRATDCCPAPPRSKCASLAAACSRTERRAVSGGAGRCWPEDPSARFAFGLRLLVDGITAHRASLHAVADDGVQSRN
jgi:hypothetical protein